ncbi:MAG: hypothetical protein ACOC97_02420 [Myxococcota bacterium]
MTTLRDLLASDSPDIRAIEQYLDELDNEARIREVRTLGRAHQRRLFDAAAGHKPIDLSFLVPPEKGPMEGVYHWGKNSLGAFTHFAKVFCRPDDDAAAADQRWGYNSSGSVVNTFVGPGYFVAHPFDVEGEVLVDYLMVPPRKPEGWPKILPNDARLSRFVYNGTQDILRGVSKHVSIGRATKGGENMNAWFVLCREDS